MMKGSRTRPNENKAVPQVPYTSSWGHCGEVVLYNADFHSLFPPEIPFFNFFHFSSQSATASQPPVRLSLRDCLTMYMSPASAKTPVSVTSDDLIHMFETGLADRHYGCPRLCDLLHATTPSALTMLAMTTYPAADLSCLDPGSRTVD